MKRAKLLATVMIGITVGAIAGPGITGGSARASGQARTYRCLNDHAGTANGVSLIVTIHNPTGSEAKVAERHREDGGSVVTELDRVIPPRGSITVGYAGATEGIAVLELTSSTKLLLDGFVYHQHPLEDELDHMRQVKCT